MKIEEAIEIVLALARQNILSEEDAEQDDGLQLQRINQIEATDTIEDFFVNTIFG